MNCVTTKGDVRQMTALITRVGCASIAPRDLPKAHLLVSHSDHSLASGAWFPVYAYSLHVSSKHIIYKISSVLRQEQFANIELCVQKLP